MGALGVNMASDCPRANQCLTTTPRLDGSPVLRSKNPAYMVLRPRITSSLDIALHDVTLTSRVWMFSRACHCTVPG
jgi:hypothetical protein